MERLVYDSRNIINMRFSDKIDALAEEKQELESPG